MINELFGWTAILLGLGVGIWMGLRFQREDWLKGYASLPRRMVRLAHVALAALGIINIAFAHTSRDLALPASLVTVASWALIIAAISMPACCLAIARGSRRFGLFGLPVSSLAAAVGITIGGLLR